MSVDRRPRIGVVTFPGSLDDRDALRAVRVTVSYTHLTLPTTERV